MPFHAEVFHAGRAATLRMVGDLNATADVELLAAHAQAAADDPRMLVLDFSDVDYINSSGIALVVTLLIDARAAGRAVRAAGLSPHYRHIFEITRLTDYLTFDHANGGRQVDDAAETATGGSTHG